jgi:Lon protease-like protein
MELPLFPLHRVLFPGVALPLHVFEERYRTMVARCLEDDRPFGVVLIRDGREVGRGPMAIATVGTVAEIREASRFSDGRFELLAVGTRRFRVESLTVGREPYTVARVDPIDDPIGEAATARLLTERVTQRFVRYLTLLQPMEGEDAEEVDVQVELDLDDDSDDPTERIGSGDQSATPRLDRRRPSGDGPLDDRLGGPDARDRLDDVARRVAIPDDPTVLSYLLSGIIQIEQPKRQDLLESETTVARLGELIRLIDREIVLLGRRLRNFTVDPRLAVLRRN